MTIVHTQSSSPVKYIFQGCLFSVYSEYQIPAKNLTGIINKLQNTQYGVVGIGQHEGFTETRVCGPNGVIGSRRKISIFTDEPSQVSPILNAIDIPNTKIRLGVVICKEVLHTAIAEVYRMMEVNLLATVMGNDGEFTGVQRASWIDQMILFTDIVRAPMIAGSGASTQSGGINVVIENK